MENGTGGNLHVQREPLTQTSFWHQAAGSVAPFESESAPCQRSSQCLLPVGPGIPAGHHLCPWQRSVPHPRQKCEPGYHPMAGEVSLAHSTSAVMGILPIPGKEKTELRVKSRRGQEVQRSGEVRAKQTSNHLWATKSVLSCQTKEALQSCLTGKPARKTTYITPTKCLTARKKEVRKPSMIKKPQKHQEKIVGTLFKQPKVRKYVIK